MTLLELLRESLADPPKSPRILNGILNLMEASVTYTARSDAPDSVQNDVALDGLAGSVLERAYVLGHAVIDARREAGGS